MAFYRFLCGCGHVVTAAPWEELAAHWHNGPAGLRSRAACPKCAARTAHADAADLRPLEGPAFQVAWAADLRNRHLAALTRLIRGLPEAEQKALTRHLMRLMNRHPDAAWWITHRDNPFPAFVPDAPPKLRHWVITLAYGEAPSAGRARPRARR
ncbi:MAG: hypothetical protein K6W08_16130 [Firmicutes bacterium]|nr:hypothetical protein [Bacillota bacterium]